jgi:4-methyl-5(b-hydroxyethyl)-thiazole monophosphate biosynthesis
MTKKVLVTIADGIEEIEAVCIIDVLRRADAFVTVASVNSLQVTASHGVKIIADKLISDCIDNTYDLIVLPGGIPGAEHLRDSQELKMLLKKQQQEGRLYAAICASPAVVLQHHGLLGKRKATCHPYCADQIENKSAIKARVVVDDNCITSRGPGTALDFSLKLVELLYNEQKAVDVAQPMVVG